MKKTLLTIAILLSLVISIISSPQIALNAASNGFNIWWSYLFPVLLPMYLLLTLCHALGLFHSISYLIIRFAKLASITTQQLVPYIYRFFSGLASTPQSSILIVTQQSNNLTKRQVTLLHALSYGSNPIFIIVVVFTAFINQPFLGLYLVANLFIATCICAAIFRQYKRPKSTASDHTSVHTLLDELENGRKDDGRSIGKLLGEGIYDSVQQLFSIGGIMLFGSVIASYLQQLLPQTIPFQFAYIIEQHVATYTLIQSQFDFRMLLIYLGCILSAGGLIQLFLHIDQIKLSGLSVFGFCIVRLVHISLTSLLIMISYPFIDHLLKLPTSIQTFSDYTILSTTLAPSPFVLFSFSLAITSLFMIGLLFLNQLLQSLLLYFHNKK